MKKIFTLIIIIAILGSCKTKKNMTENSGFKPDYTPGPPTIVYKTKQDYSDKVPVILNKDKTEIVTYFSPNDFIRKGKIVYPTKLENGYLLDNLGINENVAFTNIKIDIYTKAMRPYTVKQLYEAIIDKDPLIEMYNCGNRSKFDNLIPKLNELIKNDELKNCKKLY